MVLPCLARLALLGSSGSTSNLKELPSKLRAETKPEADKEGSRSPMGEV